jgi:hypothetical protein
VSRVDQDAHAIAGASDGVVHLHTLGVASASLHTAVQKMSVDGVEDDLRNLRDDDGGVIEQVEPLRLKGEDSQATLRITTLTLAPEGSHRPHASVFRRGLTPSQQPFMCLGFRSS